MSIRVISAWVLVAVGLLALSFAQEIFPGWCPSQVKPMDSFLIQNYSGQWYEIEKYRFIPEAKSSCVRVNYADHGLDDKTFTANILQSVNGKIWENPGITRYLTKDGKASFVLDLIVSQSPLPFVVSYPYIVIDTDYKTYTIKYACKQVGFYNMQTIWILAREKFLTPEVLTSIHKKLSSLGIDTSRLRTSDLSTCPTKPAVVRDSRKFRSWFNTIF